MNADFQEANWVWTLVFAFDKEIMHGNATGYSGSNERGFMIRGDEDLAHAFAKAKRLAIFKNTDKPTLILVVNLLGSSTGLVRLRSCVADIKREQTQAASTARALEAKREIIPADPFFDPNEVVPVTAPSGWITFDDYPARALREGREGDTIFSVTVAPSGAVTNCQVISSSGHADLDAATCTLVTRRARFNSIPKDAGDRTYQNVIRWQLFN